MSNTKILGLLVGALVCGAVGGFVVHTMLPAPNQIVEQVAGAAPAGSTFATAKFYAINMAPAAAGQNATSSSLLNTDSNDRIIQDVTYSCASVGTSGAANGSTGGLAAWLFKMATSSVIATSTFTNSTGGTNSNFVLLTQVATSTSELFVASTTPGLTATVDFRRWAAGSYLSILINATNTAACTIGVHAMGT